VEPAPIAALLTGRLEHAQDEVARAMGRVALWGDVVECERGWRASHAYPLDLYVCAPAWPTTAVDKLVDELERYAVPIRRVRSNDAEALLRAVLGRC
jgi:hypothetical protein